MASVAKRRLKLALAYRLQLRRVALRQIRFTALEVRREFLALPADFLRRLGQEHSLQLVEILQRLAGVLADVFRVLLLIRGGAANHRDEPALQLVEQRLMLLAPGLVGSRVGLAGSGFRAIASILASLDDLGRRVDAAQV